MKTSLSLKQKNVAGFCGLLALIVFLYIFPSISSYFMNRHAASLLSVQVHGVPAEAISVDSFSLLGKNRWSVTEKIPGIFSRGPAYLSGFEIQLHTDDLEKIEAIDVRIGGGQQVVVSEDLDEYFQISQSGEGILLRSKGRFFANRSHFPILNQCMTWKGDFRVAGQVLRMYFPVLLWVLFPLGIVMMWTDENGRFRKFDCKNRIQPCASGQNSADQGVLRGISSLRKPYGSSYFQIVLLAFTLLCFFLFMNQSLPGENYVSDVRAHISFVGNGYSFLHLMLGWFQSVLVCLSRRNNLYLPHILMACALTASVSLVVITLNIYLKRKYKDVSPYFSDFFSLVLVVVSMLIYNPANIGRLYLGISTPNAWHNPTVLFCKIFSLGTFIIMYSLFSGSLNKRPPSRIFIGLSFCSFLSMWAKPSFLLSFLPSVFFVLFYLLIRRKIRPYVFIMTGVSLLFSLFPLWLIHAKVYTSSDASNSVIIAFDAAQIGLVHMLVSVLLSSAFPLFVLCVTIRKKKLSSLFGLAIVNYLIATLIQFFLAESGDRMHHGNFGWSFQLALFFLFMVAVEEFFFKKQNSSAGIRIAGSYLFIGHLLSGLYYFGVVLLGYSYG